MYTNLSLLVTQVKFILNIPFKPKHHSHMIYIVNVQLMAVTDDLVTFSHLKLRITKLKKRTSEITNEMHLII